MECFGPQFFALIAVILTLFILSVTSGAMGSSERPTIVTLYTMDNCGPCEAVKRILKANGTDVTIDYVTTQSLVDSYPTCVYSNGKVDTGLRVRFRACDFPENITIIHYKGY